MKAIKTTAQFLRDLKLARKRGRDVAKIEAVIDAIAHGKKLAPRHRPHRLRGELEGFWECHVEPDCLMIWDEDDRQIVLVRCGTHADLFE